MKRLMDIVLVICASPLIVPLAVIVAVMVARRLGSPILFTQTRPGLNGEPFTMYKFRTMLDTRGPDGELLPDADRLTGFGKRLRRTSLDELPEFWNVLKGDMSLVGPRPLLMEYLELYSPHQARRHEVRPGITGWAQINGRNALTWEEKFAHDIWYVDNRSLLLDLKILFRTIMSALSGQGISADGHATMPRFTGEPSAGDKK